MKAKYIDLSGQTFGRLTVISRGGPRPQTGARAALWVCQCECGKRKEVSGYNLRSGQSRSCGCWSGQFAAQKIRRHGMYDSAIYKVWKAMKQRCTNPRSQRWASYGGRGIKLCAQWYAFEGFLADMGAAYRHGLSIDRIDVNGDYEPNNCKWATPIEQGAHIRRRATLTYRGQTKSISEWSRETGIPTYTLSLRRDRGYAPEQIFSPTKLQCGAPSHARNRNKAAA